MDIDSVIKENIIFSLSNKYKPMKNTNIFFRIVDSLFNLLCYKKLDLSYEEAKERFLEDLQEWDYIINLLPKEEIKEVDDGKRLRELYLKEQEIIKMQLGAG